MRCVTKIKPTLTVKSGPHPHKYLAGFNHTLAVSGLVNLRLLDSPRVQGTFLKVVGGEARINNHVSRGDYVDSFGHSHDMRIGP